MKRGIDLVTPPHGVEVPEGHRNDYRPVLVAFSYHRVVWITSEKVIEPGKVEFQWVLADRDGNVKATFTGERKHLPAVFRKYTGDRRVNKWKIAHIVQGNYGYGDGWEDEYTSFDRKDARDRLKEYRANANGAYRLIRRKVLNPEWEAK